MAHSTLLEKHIPIQMSDLFSYAAIQAALAGLFISAFICLGNHFISAFATDIASRIVAQLINGLSILGLRSNETQVFFARDLRITNSNSREHWKWIRDQRETKFTEAAELLKVFSLEIVAKTNFNKISPETNYSAHLIFKTTPNSKGLDTFQGASVSAGDLQWKKVVCINPRGARSRNKCIGLPVRRSDGWMELELGRFNYCDDKSGNQDVVMSVTETDEDNAMSGLIVAATEMRPF